MTLPPAITKNSLAYALQNVQNIAAVAKTTTTNAVATMVAGPVDTTFIFNLLNGLRSLIDTLSTSETTAGLDSYSTAQVPGYIGTMTTDINTTQAAAQTCIDWVVNNFPKDSTASFLLAETLNADGTRTMRSFSPAQTAGFRTVLNNLTATIG